MPSYFPRWKSTNNVKDYTCPNGHVVVSEVEAAGFLGNPNRLCSECGLVAYVDAYCEWADYSPKDKRIHIVGIVVGTFFPGSFLGVFVGAIALLAAVLLDVPEGALLPIFWTGVAAGMISIPVRAARKIALSRERKPYGSSDLSTPAQPLN